MIAYVLNLITATAAVLSLMVGTANVVFDRLWLAGACAAIAGAGGAYLIHFARNR